MRLPKVLDMDLTYYIAGPMSGIEHFNYPAFDKAYQALTDAGLKVESPHLNPWPGERVDTGEELWQFMMKSAIRQLLKCQGIITLRGWTASRGALVEVNIASALRMPSYFLDEDRLVPMHLHTRAGDE